MHVTYGWFLIQWFLLFVFMCLFSNEKNRLFEDHICLSVCDLVSVTEVFLRLSCHLVSGFLTNSC